jgi:predicted Zn-dependent protease
MPDDEEVMPALGQVLETREFAFNADSEAMEIETMGEWAAAACHQGAAAGIDLAGLLSLGKKFCAYGDSAGGFAYERYHRSDYHVTATGNSGSGWAENQGVSIKRDDVMQATTRAIDKCVKAQNPEVFEPRPTTVILEPQAVGDLMSMKAAPLFQIIMKHSASSRFIQIPRAKYSPLFHFQPMARNWLKASG